MCVYMNQLCKHTLCAEVMIESSAYGLLTLFRSSVLEYVNDRNGMACNQFDSIDSACPALLCCDGLTVMRRQVSNGSILFLNWTKQVI